MFVYEQSPKDEFNNLMSELRLKHLPLFWGESKKYSVTVKETNRFVQFLISEEDFEDVKKRIKSLDPNLFYERHSIFLKDYEWVYEKFYDPVPVKEVLTKAVRMNVFTEVCKLSWMLLNTLQGIDYDLLKKLITVTDNAFLEIAKNDLMKRIIVKEKIFSEDYFEVFDSKALEEAEEKNKENEEMIRKAEEKVDDRTARIAEVVRISQKEKEKEAIINALLSRKLKKDLKNINKEELTWEKLY